MSSDMSFRMSSFLYSFPSRAVTVASSSASPVTMRVMTVLRGISRSPARFSAVRLSLSSAAAKETMGAAMLVPDVPSPLVR